MSKYDLVFNSFCAVVIWLIWANTENELFLYECRAKSVNYTLSRSWHSGIHCGWGKLLASASRLFIAVASVETSLSKTVTGCSQPAGRMGSAEKLGEKWINEMGLPPLSGSLWDSPPQIGKSVLMIVVGEIRKEEEEEHQVAFALASCVTLVFLGGWGWGTSKSHGRSVT